MTDTFDFFKNMWSSMPGMNLPGMNLPGMVMPTLSVDEINKQIKDLKAVESWLSLNLSMLQGTIQALEVQKATIATLQTMGESFSAAMHPPAKSEISSRSPFESPFSMPSPAKPAAVEPAPAEKSADAESASGEQPNMIPPMANPAIWWNMLQDQFKQAVDSAAAMAPDTSAQPGTAEAPTTAETPRKRKSAPKA
jgi:hypothetical protein